MTSKDPISTLETDTQTIMRTDIATDILRQIFEMLAEDDMRFARDVLVYVNREVRAWVDLLLYRSLSLHSLSQVHLLTQSLISKSQCPHQSHTFPSLAHATHTLLLPTVSVHADLVYLLSTLKGVRNLSWAPERRVGREVRGLVMGLRLVRLWTRLGAFMDDPYDISDSEDGSTSVLPPGMLDNATHLTLVDPIEEWAKWDWKAILARRKGGIEGLKWISLCAAKSHVRLEREMMWEYMEPPSADKEFFVDGLNVTNRGGGGDAKSKLRDEDTIRSSNGNGIVCICCVKINEDEHASHPPYTAAHIVDKTVHYSRAELWMRMLGIDMNGLEKCSADRDQIGMDNAPGFMWEEHRTRFGVLYGRLLEPQ